ncbi:hypothetical protein KP509_39G053800 [Ceratopteris richardii]|uniref:Secreted protein n=1 Tax=Ceratopteris richardii TaxID=49495 RepID=A0A8T2Q210_CERRI|nr:hypothetical protein KP509_39G053800 [Ceratopteris richardii]
MLWIFCSLVVLSSPLLWHRIWRSYLLLIKAVISSHVTPLPTHREGFLIYLIRNKNSRTFCSSFWIELQACL